MADIPKEVKDLCEMHCRLMSLDLFDGPDTIRTREFMKIMQGKEPSSIEEIRKQLDAYYKKREDIINAYVRLGVQEGSCVRGDDSGGEEENQVSEVQDLF